MFVDDLVDVLDHPGLTVAELDRKLGRAFDGLLVLPAPTDPSRMARLDKAAYTKVFERLKMSVGTLVLDCGTGLQEPSAAAAIEAADQIVLVTDAEPSTASLVAEAAQLLKRAGPPMFLIVNKLPRKGGAPRPGDALPRGAGRPRADPRVRGAGERVGAGGGRLDLGRRAGRLADLTARAGRGDGGGLAGAGAGYVGVRQTSMTTLPRAWPSSRYAIASGTSASG